MSTTRYLGLCPCCRRTHKVRGAVLVHHGYQRPGYGYIQGDCFGALRTPHEVSNETARAYRDATMEAIFAVQEALKDLPNRESFSKYNPVSEKLETVKKGEPGFARAMADAKAEMEGNLAGLRIELEEVNKLIATWEKKALVSVEEETAKKKVASEAKKAARKAEREAKAQEKAERAKAREEARVAKLKAKVASLQAAIDKAWAKKDSKKLAELWVKVQVKLSEVDWACMDFAKCLKVVDRDEVWAHYGLKGYDISGYRRTKAAERPWCEAIRAMGGRVYDYTV